MNMAALIGEVASEVEASGDDDIRFSLAVARRGGDSAERVDVFASGAQAAACRAFLRPGHRVAIEGRVAPGAAPAEVVAERVQFLTTRAEAEAMVTTQEVDSK
jgi:Single-strand binding protein family